MDARATVDEYYDALQTGEPLAPFFAAERAGDDAYVKFGLSEQLVGSDPDSGRPSGARRRRRPTGT